MVHVTLLDNLDSFTWNIVHSLEKQGASVKVLRSDQSTLKDIQDDLKDLLILSPGPGKPTDTPLLHTALETIHAPIFGICLGLQAIGMFYGMSLIPNKALSHGGILDIHHNHNSPLYKNIPSPFTSTEYHSLVLNPASLPECLEITAQDNNGQIMGLRHKTRPIEGVQFHPEATRSPFEKEFFHALLRKFI